MTRVYQLFESFESIKFLLHQQTNNRIECENPNLFGLKLECSDSSLSITKTLVIWCLKGRNFSQNARILILLSLIDNYDINVWYRNRLLRSNRTKRLTRLVWGERKREREREFYKSKTALPLPPQIPRA